MTKTNRTLSPIVAGNTRSFLFELWFDGKPVDITGYEVRLTLTNDAVDGGAPVEKRAVCPAGDASKQGRYRLVLTSTDTQGLVPGVYSYVFSAQSRQDGPTVPNPLASGRVAVVAPIGGIGR